jgi:hypothetical protein
MIFRQIIFLKKSIHKPTSRITLFLRGLQGWPAHTIQAGMSLVTTEHAPITAPSLMVTPGCIKQLLVTQAFSSITIGA